jgi:hypothetical protein
MEKRDAGSYPAEPQAEIEQLADDALDPSRTEAGVHGS